MIKYFLTISISLLFSASIMAQDVASATKLYNEGATLLNDGNKTEALAVFEKALAEADLVGPDAMEVAENCKTIICTLHLAMAKELISDKNNDAALEALKNTIQKSEEFGQYDTAEEAIDLTSKLYMSIGNTALTQGNFEEAIKQYDLSLEYKPNNGIVYLRKGMAYSRLENEEATVEAFNKAAENGQKTAAANELSKYYLKAAAENLKAKKYDEAYTAAQKSHAVKNSSQALYISGISAFYQKKYAETIDALEEYIAANPNSKDANQAMYQLAVSYENTGNKAKACGYYKQIMKDPVLGEFATHKVNVELKCN